MENNRVHLQNTEHTAILPKVGPAACHSEANEEARLVERKVCFIPEAGSKEGLGTGMLVFISRSWYELTSSFLLEIVFFFWGKNSGGKKKDFINQAFSDWICKRNQFWSFKGVSFISTIFFQSLKKNWNVISHFSKGNKNTNHTKWNTDSYSRRQSCQKPSRRLPTWSLKRNTSNTNRPQRQIHVRTDCQHTRITLSAHKLLSGRPLSEPVGKKCPNSTSPSKEKVAGCTWVDLLRLGARQLVQRHLSIPLTKNTGWQPMLSRGETGRIPKTNGIDGC